MHMDYCMEHPEELTKVAAVQKKVCVSKSPDTAVQYCHTLAPDKAHVP